MLSPMIDAACICAAALVTVSASGSVLALIAWIYSVVSVPADVLVS